MYCSGTLVIGVELEAFAFLFGQGRFGDVDPGLRLLDIPFHLTDRIHVFIELLLVVISKFAPDAVGIFKNKVEKVGGTFESTAVSSRYLDRQLRRGVRKCGAVD
jgi:hypothetical protein